MSGLWYSRIKSRVPVLGLLFALFFIGFRVHGQGSLPNTFSLGIPPMIIHLPGPVKPMEVKIDPMTIQMIHSFYAYQYEDVRAGIDVRLFQITYSGVQDMNSKTIVEQTMHELESGDDHNFNYNQRQIEVDGKKGLRLTGTCKEKDRKEKFTGYIFIDNKRVWKAIAFYNMGDRAGEEAAEEILDSISFRDSSTVIRQP
jgi:hypothetical protein